MPARVVRLPIVSGFWPFSGIVTRVAREVKLWRWRRRRSQIGAPVTIPRRRPGRGFMFESRRSGASPGV
jgi:hypothetical protein